MSTITQQTKAIVSSMLKENTGRHFLDSGGAYGRNWERNQTREFEEEPAVTAEFDQEEDGTIRITANVSVYHYLTQNMEYSEWMDRCFHEFAMRPEHEDKYWLEIAEAFMLWLKDLADFCGYDFEQEYGENTYNRECAFSQTLQYGVFLFDDEYYALIQIHGGCDVRGGYTAPRAFTFIGDQEQYALTQDTQLDVYCPVCGSSWYTDDGWHWYDNGNGNSLADAFITEVAEGGMFSPDELSKKLWIQLPESKDLHEYKISDLIDEDGHCHCPVCSQVYELEDSGILEVSHIYCS